LPAAYFICLAYLDFLRGPALFHQKDADKLNKELLEEKKTLSFGSRLPLIRNTLESSLKIAIRFASNYKNIKKQFQLEHSNLTSVQYWCEWLGIVPLTNWSSGEEM